ncbi:MAG: hypothetical protein ACRDJN_04830 [Chloroflexota bacterium]
MVVMAEAIRLTEETARELRAQGQHERADALETVLAAAAAKAPPIDQGAYEPLGQVARRTGLDAGLIREWIAVASHAGTTSSAPVGDAVCAACAAPVRVLPHEWVDVDGPPHHPQTYTVSKRLQHI